MRSVGFDSPFRQGKRGQRDDGAGAPSPSPDSALAAPHAGGRMRSRAAQYGISLAAVAVVLIAWQIIGGRINPILISTPSATVSAWFTLIGNGQLGTAFRIAMEDLFAGFALAIVVGIVLGVWIGRSPFVERVSDPFLNFFQATPLIAMVPLIVIWFGINFEARVAVTFILALPSIIINTAVGVKTTPDSLIDVGRVYHLSRWRVIKEIALPNAVPAIFAGLRISLGKALIGMMIAEMEVSINGLGGLVVNYGDAFRTDYLLAGVFTASLVGVIAAILLEVARRFFFPWTNKTMKSQ